MGLELGVWGDESSKLKAQKLKLQELHDSGFLTLRFCGDNSGIYREHRQGRLCYQIKESGRNVFSSMTSNANTLILK